MARNPWQLGFGACGTKFDEYGPLFIGLLGPTCRGDGVLNFLSINQTLIWLHLKDFWKGLNFGLVTIWKPSSRLGKHRLRKIPYPESGRRVWSGQRRVTTRVSQVKAFSLSGSYRVSRVRVAGLARLRSDKAKTSPRAGFSLIPKPGPG
jgi:hypothetical protein